MLLKLIQSKIISIVAIANLAEANFEFYTSPKNDLEVIWTKTYTTFNDCIIRVESRDIMDKPFRVDRKLSMANHVKIRLSIVQLGTRIGACLICPRRMNYQDNPHCESFVVKPSPVNFPRCETGVNTIKFQFDHPRDGFYEGIQVELKPPEGEFLPRILGKDLNEITFKNLMPGKSYKIIAKTLVGQGFSETSKPVEITCTTKMQTDETKDRTIQSENNITEEEMLLMIQAQTAIMKMVILLTFVVLLMLVISTFILHHIMRLKHLGSFNRLKRDLEMGNEKIYQCNELVNVK